MTELIISDGGGSQEGSLSLAAQSAQFCELIERHVDLEPTGIAESLVREGVLPPEFLAVFGPEIMGVITEVRNNTKAATGKKPALAAALREESEEAVQTFLTDNGDRLAEVMHLSSQIIHHLQLTTHILSVKDLGALSNAELHDGLVSIVDLEKIVQKRICEVIAIKLAAILSAELEITAVPNQGDRLGHMAHNNKDNEGTIDVGREHYEKAVLRVEEYIAQEFPDIKFYVQSSGLIPARALRIYIAGKK